MSVVIDTHVLIWSLFNLPELTPSARGWIEDAPEVFVSVASIYEIDFKRRGNRLRSRDAYLRRMPANMPAALPSFGYTLLPVDAETAWVAARLPIDHGDPWDRILLAQALIRDVPLVSADDRLRASAERHSKTTGVIVF